MKEPVPPGWDPEVWYRHLQNIEWLKAMGLHTSVTDPVTNVKRFREKVVLEFAENTKTFRVDPESLPSGAVLEREILRKIETVDLSKADVVILRSQSTMEGIDQLVVAQLAKTLKAQRGQDAIVLVMRPQEGLEVFNKDGVKEDLIRRLRMALTAHHEDGDCRCKELDVLPKEGDLF